MSYLSRALFVLKLGAGRPGAHADREPMQYTRAGRPAAQCARQHGGASQPGRNDGFWLPKMTAKLQRKASDFAIFRLLGQLGSTLGGLRAPGGSKERALWLQRLRRTAPRGPKGVPSASKGLPKRSQGGQNAAKEAPKEGFEEIWAPKMARERHFSQICYQKSNLRKSWFYLSKTIDFGGSAT